MAPRSSGKKSAAGSWLQCSQCEIHIVANDQDRHNKLCPITHDNFDGNMGLEYIWKNAFYKCNIEAKTFATNELADMPNRFLNNLIFISETAIRLLNFYIGQDVMVHRVDNSDAVPLVRSIWPIPSSFATSVFVTSQDLQYHWEDWKRANLKIARLPNELVTMAKKVQLGLDSTQGLESCEVFNKKQIQDMERILRQELQDFIYTEGSTIVLNFFNKILHYVVIGWEAIARTMDPLDIAFDKLKLNDKGRSFFKIISATELEVMYKCANMPDEDTVNSPKREVPDVGGMDEELNMIEEALRTSLGFQDMPKGVKMARSILLYGPSGCGKTLICKAMAARLLSLEANSNVIEINSSEVFSRFLGESEKNLRRHFERAFREYPKPALIIIEDVHNLCPKHETHELSKRIAVAMFSMLDELNSKQEGRRTFLLATTSNLEALSPAIRRCGRLDIEIEIGVPSPFARRQILQCLLRKVENNLSEGDIKDIAHVTHGFVGGDLANLISKSALAAFKLSKSCMEMLDVQESLTSVKPSAMREILIESPNVRWTDIGGQDELKLQLRQAIEWPLLYPEKFRHFGIKPPRGILMFGPPGCSKTMIAKALATESQLNFISIKGPELFSMWVGESERAVRDVFRKARQVAPAIVFFDEIDSISSERSDSGSGSSVKERVLTQLLVEIDGVVALRNVTIIAATNRPDMIDKALLRPGRFDRIIYVGLPDAAARRDIFRIKLKSMPLADDVDIVKLVEKTDGYSGAEIEAICHEAALKTLEKDLDAEVVQWTQFEHALQAILPRTSPQLLDIYKEYMKRDA